MTSRERVRTVLGGGVPDRVPVILGVSNATGIKMGVYRQMKELAGIDEPDRYIYDWPELGTALPGEAGLTRLHSDVRGVHDRFPAWVYERNQSREPHSPYIDSWGSGAKEIRPGEWYPGVHPLADATTVEEIETYEGWPDMDDPTRYSHIREEAAQLAAAGEYAIMATPWLLFPFERAFAMQGMDTFLLNMAMYPEFAVALLRKHLELCKTLMGHVLEELGDNVDIIKIGDDLGSQEGLLMSPAMYREMLAPIHAEFVRFIRERTSAKVFFHTDGDVFDLIPDFIEMGVDILNPIQTSAGRMSDLERLKSEYGGAITFCGAIDTHHILPHGTPEEVRAEVRRVIDILGKGGGYMLASVHTIMNDVPPENVLAMVDAVEEFGAYA
jgi:uroporphyrinogen decarboxylase